MSVEELRKTDRFVIVEPFPATFGAFEATVINVSIGGVQISHPQPIRIGTMARLSFSKGDAVVVTQARVLWSHVAPSAGGKLLYRSGLKIEAVDPQYALALNTLIRAGIARQDLESLDRKRQRDEEREAKKKSGPRFIPTSEPPPA
jgi:PilZ domain